LTENAKPQTARFIGMPISHNQKIVRPRIARLINTALLAALLITLICVFVPFSPEMPAAGLDPSWMHSMNEAVAQGFAFGKDIIFTFGPYASIYTKTYHPATDFMMIGGSLYLALSYWICLVVLIKGVPWRWPIALCAALACITISRDALLFLYPLLVCLTCYKITAITDCERVASIYSSPFFVFVIFMPFGLLVLIKGTILILCSVMILLCCIFFIFNRKITHTIACLASPVFSTTLFWLASGQYIADLACYFTSMAPIISGYSEAMSIGGDALDTILYYLASVFLLVSIYKEKILRIPFKLYLLCVYFVFLFMSFKAGFILHDSNHACIAGTAVLLAALSLPFVIKTRLLFLALVLCIISWSYIYIEYSKTSTLRIPNNIIETYSKTWTGLKNRMEKDLWLKHRFDSAQDALRKQASFPIMQGSTDIYYLNQSYLIASGNNWRPRPILQSYSAYSPWLAEKNMRHLLGVKAPDNIIFSINPLIYRFPSLDDGASWPILMTNYRPTHMAKDYLFLKKKGVINDIAETSILATETHAFGETVILPESEQPIFAEIEITTNILGRIASFAFKQPSPLEIRIKLKNGSSREFRIIPGMIKAGFLLSPLIENSTEFGLLYCKGGYLDAKRVKSFTIMPRDDQPIYWDNQYVVKFRQLKKTYPPIAPLAIYRINKFADALPKEKTKLTHDCHGFIDKIDDTFINTKEASSLLTSGLLRANGWLAVSFDKGILPDAVYVVLTDRFGRHSYLTTDQTVRHDFNTFAKRPDLKDSGFRVFADISSMDGQYTVGLAYKKGDKVNICPQFKIPLKISRIIEGGANSPTKSK
jgi:hypothetical protein